MDFSRSFAISTAGMAAERTRVEVAALNLANANTMQTGAGGYQPLRVVMRSTAAPVDFATQVAVGETASAASGLPLPEADIEPSGMPARQVYDPTNPFADGQGNVAYPAVDTATEMVAMMGAVRAYESNVAAMNTAKTLALKALEIGGTSS